MFLEPLLHNLSLVTWRVILLADSISRINERRHVRMLLVRNDVLIIRSFHGMFYHNHRWQKCPPECPPKPNTATTDLCMTWCTLGKQLYSGRLYSDTAIDLTNRDSFDQVTLSQWSMFQSRFFRAQCRCSWRWLFINRGTWVGHLLRSPISNNVRGNASHRNNSICICIVLVYHLSPCMAAVCFTKRDVLRHQFSS